MPTRNEGGQETDPRPVQAGSAVQADRQAVRASLRGDSPGAGLGGDRKESDLQAHESGGLGSNPQPMAQGNDALPHSQGTGNGGDDGAFQMQEIRLTFLGWLSLNLGGKERAVKVYNRMAEFAAFRAGLQPGQGYPAIVFNERGGDFIALKHTQE